MTHRRTWVLLRQTSLILFLVQSSKFLKSCSTVSGCVHHLLQESTENERAYCISRSDVLVLATLFWIRHLDWRFISHLVSYVSERVGMKPILNKMMRMRHLTDKWKFKCDYRHRHKQWFCPNLNNKKSSNKDKEREIRSKLLPQKRSSTVLLLIMKLNENSSVIIGTDFHLFHR